MGPSSIRSSSPSSLQVPTAEDSAVNGLGFGAGAGTVYPQWKSLDPRTSSTQSLAPSVNRDETDTRRTLLIVYIHGFMGNDSSFRSFPAHVHSYLRTALAESHVIHSKIYPRYKTYKAIEVARDNFSSWLEPHESPTTDVILVGHSMGGLLAAEIVLIPSRDPQSEYPFKHRILGTISLDSPFLGLHPGIIVSGIASLFRKSPDPPKEDGSTEADALTITTDSSQPLSPDPSIYSELASHSSITSPTTSNAPSSSLSPGPGPDPFFNPPFFNDVLFKDRGWWKNVAHFAKKHKPEGLVTAARQHIINHLEFGACLMDYVALNQRYDKLRHLDDVDDFDMSSGQGGAPGPRKEARVRFVNYFTLSTGRTKSPSPTRSPRSPTRSTGAQSARSSRRGSGVHLRPEAASAPASQRTSFDGESRPSTPRISIEDHSDGSRIEVVQSISPDDPLPPPYSEHELDALPDAAEGRELAEITEIPGQESSESPESPSVPRDTAGSEQKQDQEQGQEQEKPEEATAAAAAAAAAADPEILAKLDLPAIPEPPEPPQLHNLEAYTDKDARKQAERENKRSQKSYEQAVKNRDKAIKERQKLVEKQRKKAQKEAEKQAKDEEKRRKQGELAQKKTADAEAREAQKRAEEEQKRLKAEELALTREADELEQRLRQQQLDATTTTTIPQSSPEKKKERKFCTLPRKSNGVRDPTWVDIHMEGVDEVGAHCGLFFPGPHYEKLIGDVGSRIVHWVQEDASKRAIFALADWR